MISNNHYIELYINKGLIELESQESLGIRINNVLFNPTKTSTTQAGYSFSFQIPSTPNNDRILNYANVLSQTNKFHARYSSQLYADGNLIFDGSLTVQKYDASSKEYTCNLVNIKINTIDEIFGDRTLTSLKWEVPFSGATTINSVNTDMSKKYYFPFLSYGVFQKVPYDTDEVGNSYTSKFEIDKYNRFWVETFYPSLNVMETLRKAFENMTDSEGNTYVIGGSAFSDQNISNIYASCNLASEQVPIYNLGNPLFGECDISASYTTLDTGYQQELDYPYFQVGIVGYDGSSFTSDTEYNFSSVDIHRPLAGNSVTVNNPTYMFDPGEQVVVIPADGWYRIELSATTTLNTTGNITAAQYQVDFVDKELFYEDVTMPVGLHEITPVEIQIVKNYDDNIELIKGKHNRKYANGNPNDTQYERGGITYDNVTNWLTCCPHEDPYNAINPTEKNDLTFKNSKSNLGGKRTSDSNSFGGSYSSDSAPTNSFGGSYGASGRAGTRGSGGSPRQPFGRDRNYSYLNLGYIYQDDILSDGAQGACMAFDQAVTESFICGISSLSSGITSTMKNGYSWSKSNSTLNESFYASLNYDHIYRESGTGEVIQEHIDYDFNNNTYINAPSNKCKVSGNTMNGFVSCMVWLNRNDVVEPVIIHRSYEYENGNPVTYQTTTNLRFKVQAFSTSSRQIIKADHKNIYYRTGDPSSAYTEFPVNLNLFNFTNKETKVSDWINNVVKAFNLEVVQDGYAIDFNINRGIKKTINYAIDLDDRVNNEEVQTEYISYPREMSVKYKISVDEYGFEYSVPQAHINDENWYDYGDSGYTVINLSDDSYETSTQNTQTNFSYTWYVPFTWKQVNWDSTSGFVETGVSATTQFPVIENSEYMADGYGYDDAMRHDGYSFTQRFWFRQSPSSQYVVLADHQHETVYLSYPYNSYDGFHLSYKDTEKSIVSEYFNVAPMLSSNYLTMDVYLTPQEFTEIKGGAMIHFDNDLYFTSEIQAYDCTGNNPTTLKLIKKP